MDFLVSKRFITIILIVLVGLNLALLGVIWWQNMNMRSYRSVEVRHYFRGRSVPMETRLGLSDEQKQRFTELRKTHFSQSRPEMLEIIALKKELVTESVKNDLDTTKVAMIAEQIGIRQASLERRLAGHFHELAAVCTSDQRDTLRTMLGQIFSRKYERRSKQDDLQRLLPVSGQTTRPISEPQSR